MLSIPAAANGRKLPSRPRNPPVWIEYIFNNALPNECVFSTIAGMAMPQ
jgi:hypothetical protein